MIRRCDGLGLVGHAAVRSVSFRSRAGSRTTWRKSSVERRQLASEFLDRTGRESGAQNRLVIDVLGELEGEA